MCVFNTGAKNLLDHYAMHKFLPSLPKALLLKHGFRGLSHGESLS